ncbi:MAG: YHS domain-containing protein [Candidatus Omnitrophica bacterium]|nr:YHS domain-containing protein [Candidatus Omnitrophota bacterium]
MAKDPVCGMTVDEKNAIQGQKDNKTYYFCSTNCKVNFLSKPAGNESEDKSKSCCG